MRIHSNGYIIGGAHDKGLQYAAVARNAARGYFVKQVADRNIIIKRRGKRISYCVRRTPRIAWGTEDELALLRAQHFLRNHQDEWMTQAEFEQRLGSTFDNLTNVFKS